MHFIYTQIHKMSIGMGEKVISLTLNEAWLLV